MKKTLVIALGLAFSAYLIKANCGCGEKKPMAQVVNGREIKYSDSEFAQRSSKYAMSGEEVDDKDLMAMFEAAGLAPSSYNNQPWCLLVAKRNTPEWEKHFNLLVPFNQSWCAKAGALVVVASKNTFDWGKPSRTHSFDTGAACENMALQGVRKNLVVHGMEGFDYDRARTELQIPSDYTVEAMFAIGKQGTQEDIDALPEELRKRDAQPSQRKPLSSFVFNGTFGKEFKAR